MVLVGRSDRDAARLRWRTALLALVGWVMLASPIRAQISPGPLASAHASLEGPVQCTRCHGNRRDAMTGQCLACHKDIAWLTGRNRGLHGGTAVKGTACASCHPDHAGKDFEMVQWPEGSAVQFDHARAGWPLRQKHAESACKDCHVAKYAVSPPANLSARKTGQGYTGLGTTCTSCHEDIHRAALGQNCTQCHDAAGWTATPGFDHDTTAYPLTDKHTEVKCDACHLDPRLAPKSDGKGHLVPVYQPVSFATCQDCHADPHTGALGPRCADCHSTLGFAVIDKNRFDHDRTKYPLRGRHAAVSCADCHKDFATPALKKPVFATCGNCHGDAHNGTATLAGKPVDCASCHTVAGYAPSTFTVAGHATTKYPLEGMHAGARCGACHTRSGAANAAATYGSAKVVMRPAFGRCLDCHADDHGGQLRATADKGECAACHRVTGWTPSTFDSAAHAPLRLRLDGRHQEIPCAACHAAGRKNLPPMSTTASLGRANFLFKVPEVSCTACHADPHQGRFVAGGARAKDAGCATCHSTRVFRPSTADVTVHAQFGFPLAGAHRATACSACHKELGLPPAGPRSSLALAGTRFEVLSFEAKRACADCHASPHGDQFAAWDARGGCAACHSEERFAPADRFDHNTGATFSLEGAHETVPCARCHVRDPKSPDPTALIYRPLSGKCETCHATESR